MEPVTSIKIFSFKFSKLLVSKWIEFSLSSIISFNLSSAIWEGSREIDSNSLVLVKKDDKFV